MGRWLERCCTLIGDLGSEISCAACVERVSEGPAYLLCGACRSRVESAAPTTVRGVCVLAGARYSPPISLAVQRFKYGARPDLAVPFARWLLPALGPLELGPHVLLVPVPLHPRRLAERRYNQSALLCNALRGATGARPLPLGLMRLRATASQAKRARDARRFNVAGAFRARQPERLRSQRVVLVDDVVTTGATARACLCELDRAGARVLAVVALARSARPA